MQYVVTATCKNGHTQDIRVAGLCREWVEGWAGLMDGSSPFYVHPPSEHSPFGKCATCGAPFRCEVKEGESCSSASSQSVVA